MKRHFAVLILISVTVGCGLGTAKGKCVGVGCAEAVEADLSCTTTPAPSPTDHRDAVEPRDPNTCRPPVHNPGGVNGSRPERATEALTTAFSK